MHFVLILQPLFLLEAVVLLFSTRVFAQMAPGDEDAECVVSTSKFYDEPGVKILLDNRHYTQLLGAEGAVWDQKDFDKNNPEQSSYPTYVS